MLPYVQFYSEGQVPIAGFRLNVRRFSMNRLDAVLNRIAVGKTPVVA
jgi:hypothetical protein